MRVAKLEFPNGNFLNFQLEVLYYRVPGINLVYNYVCMYICMVITCSQGKGSTG